MSGAAPQEPEHPHEDAEPPRDPAGARRDAEREEDAERRRPGILGEDAGSSRRGPTS